MRKQWIFRFLAFAILLLTVSVIYKVTQYGVIVSDNFPLRQRWSIDLNQKIEVVSLMDDQTILVRTVNRLDVIDINSGKIRWNYPLAWQAIPQPAIVSDGMVYLADGKTILALNPVDGSLIWKQPVSIADAQVLTASKDVVAVKISQDLFLYDTANGSFLWNKPVCRNAFPAYVAGSYVYTACYGIRAFDMLSGEDVWEIQNANRIMNVAFEDGIIAYSPNSSTVAAFSLLERRELWRTNKRHEGFTQYKILKGRLFFTDENQFCTMQWNDGNVLWCVDGASPQNPSVMGSTAFIFNGNQNVITAIDLSSGKLIGSLQIKDHKFYSVYTQLMISTEQALIFGNGQRIYTYTE